MRYIQRINDKPFEVRSDEVTRWACCDCGLVHDIAFAARGDVIGVAARVNARATAARRRQVCVSSNPPDSASEGSTRQVEQRQRSEHALTNTSERENG